ncbi:FGGY family carbohydrate kinase, partial [Flavobacteriaceae bacterium]|nr:FGGY family carbohydrate kinase [Flavobacteriaceae bacterium]
MYYIGYDIGSSSVKVALVDAESNKKVAVLSEPEGEMGIHAPQPDWAEQDPEMWWKHLCLATQRILSENKIDAQQIRAVGISYQMHGLVLMDRQKKLLRDSIIWCDSRAVAIGDQAADAIGVQKYGTHLLNAPGNFTASKLKWVKENEPEVYEQVAYYMLPGDYIANKLTDEVVTTKNGLSEGMLWDYKEKKVADWLLDHFGIATTLTPPLVENFESQGKTTQKAALATGLPVGIPIRYRAGDQPNNALALNVLRPGEVAATGGTSGVLFAVTDRNTSQEFSRVNHFAHVNYTEEKPSIGTLLCINGAGIQYSWLKHISKSKDFNTMNRLAAEVAVGSEGLVNLPFGNGSERMLNNRNLGTHFCSLNLNLHKHAHLFRAALEGIAFSFAYGMEIMKADGLDAQVIRAGNDNLFQSEIFSTTLATLIQQPISIYNTTGAVGAARAAGLEKGELDRMNEHVNQHD